MLGYVCLACGFVLLAIKINLAINFVAKKIGSPEN
jgi:hypothetical protein